MSNQDERWLKKIEQQKHYKINGMGAQNVSKDKCQKEFLCDSCRFANETVVEYESKYTHNIIKRLAIYCKDKGCYIQKLPTYHERSKCHYKPRAGKIGKKLLQKQLW